MGVAFLVVVSNMYLRTDNGVRNVGDWGSMRTKQFTNKTDKIYVKAE
jgi:hypothetical protein